MVRADRLLHLLALLQRHRRLTAADIASRLEVSERTVLRDMEALSAAGVPVYTERGRGGGCVLLDGFSTDASGLTGDEAQAMFSWASGVSAADLGLGRELSGALAKVATTVPESAVSSGEALGAVVLADRRRWFDEAEAVPALPKLRKAATNGVRVRLDYRSRNGTIGTRTVDPYGLVDQSGRWYLVAAHRGHLRTYRVSRIEGVRQLTAPAQRDDTRPLADIWHGLRSSFEQQVPDPVTIQLQVDPEVERTFWVILQGQSVAPPSRLPDGTWECTVRAHRSALAIVLAWAPEVVLLGPEVMVEGLRERLSALQRTYDTAARP